MRDLFDRLTTGCARFAGRHFPHQLVQGDQEGSERLARAGGRGDQRIAARTDGAPAFALRFGGFREPARRVQLERAARDRVVARYDWSAVAGQLEEAVVSAATKRDAAAA